MLFCHMPFAELRVWPAERVADRNSLHRLRPYVALFGFATPSVKSPSAEGPPFEFADRPPTRVRLCFLEKGLLRLLSVRPTRHRHPCDVFLELRPGENATRTPAPLREAATETKTHRPGNSAAIRQPTNKERIQEEMTDVAPAARCRATRSPQLRRARARRRNALSDTSMTKQG